MNIRIFLTAVATLLCLQLARAAEPAVDILGIGGAGGLFSPAISPLDPKLMFITSDMSGVYRSTDGGQTWRMLHWRQLCDSLRSRPVFTKSAVIWAAGGDLRISRDKGQTWSSVVRGQRPWAGDPVERIGAISDAATLKLLVGTTAGVWRSNDAGQTWRKTADGRCHDILVLPDRVYTVIAANFLASADFGGTWETLPSPIPGEPIDSLAGAVDSTGKSVLYAANKKNIAQSTDKGKTFTTVATGLAADMVCMASGQTGTAYAAQTGGTEVFNTRDGGKTWNKCFRMGAQQGNVEPSWVQTQLKWGYSIMPLGLAAGPTNPDLAILSTQGDVYLTTDGARTWRPIMNKPLGAQGPNSDPRYASIGLEVTTTWDYLFDPADPRRTYIAYTDIGFCRSTDRGATWMSATRGCPWGNTFYQMLFDPAKPGRMYAACSDRHDIPHWTHISANTGQKGGVCVSDDYGATWRILGAGLPALPCTSICLDPKSKSPNLTFYVTMFEGGVYKSTDGGRTWTDKSQGLGNRGNLHAFMIKIHAKTNDVYCAITGHREDGRFPVAGGLWKSGDGGQSWRDLTAQLGLKWPTGFALDPRDPNVIYQAAATAPQFPQGGIYKTADGGKTWKHLLTDADMAKTGGDPYHHSMFVTLHPDRPDYVYLSTGAHGLWLSKDAGQSWRRLEHIPFRSITRLSFDPKDHRIMYVCTFGGGVLRTSAW